jgi:hypothetical protein
MRCSLCAWLLTAILPSLAPCQSVRHLTGKVLLPDGKPAQGAVVKLRDQTNGIRTAITAADGSFQFSRLLPDLDYQVRATFGNMESNHVSWSRLSSRTERNVTLILRPARRPGKASVQPGSPGQFSIGSRGRLHPTLNTARQAGRGWTLQSPVSEIPVTAPVAQAQASQFCWVACS